MGTVTVELELPEDWQALQLPEALHERLQDLLDRQDEQGGLSSQERREAEALVRLWTCWHSCACEPKLRSGD
jgi:hypothetical protein